MKKIIFTLLALVGTMSMNAQVMKVMKNGQDTPVETYSGSDYYVVFEEAPAFPFGQGYAAATGIGNVKWVQLWEKGPKFAEYNVGAASATEYGGYYTWADNIASSQWGSNWRMPTQTDLQELLSNCTVEWTQVNSVNGCKFTGKGAYASNSVFLPAAGYYYSGKANFQGGRGLYWSSSPAGYSAYGLYFDSGDQLVLNWNHSSGYSVRAVLAE